MHLARGLLVGLAAGAAGTTALNAATYLDMAARGRPASSAPEASVEALADTAGVDIPGEGDTRENRVAGLGPLTGILTGVGVGAAAGLVHGAGLRLPVALRAIGLAAAAMVGSTAPMARLGVTNPREWSAESWISDLVPHAAYGAVAAGVLSLAP